MNASTRGSCTVANGASDTNIVADTITTPSANRRDAGVAVMVASDNESCFAAALPPVASGRKFAPRGGSTALMHSLQRQGASFEQYPRFVRGQRRPEIEALRLRAGVRLEERHL